MKPDHGFSLVEVMVAVLILGVALAGLTEGITTALSSNKESELQTTAALIAAGIHAEIHLAVGGLPPFLAHLLEDEVVRRTGGRERRELDPDHRCRRQRAVRGERQDCERQDQGR